MKRIKDNYDVIAVAVLLTFFAIAQIATTTVDKSLRLVSFDQPGVTIVHD